MPKPPATWKKVESRIAAYFNTKRTPLSGQNSGHETSSDTLHPNLYIEVKYRRRHTAISLWHDTADKAAKEGKIPVCALAEKGKRGFWLLVHSSDLKNVAGEVCNS